MMATVVAVVAVAAVAAATTKTLAATAMAGITGNNQPKAAEKEMQQRWRLQSGINNNDKDYDGGDGESGDGSVPTQQATIS